jgi:hypothetical protein
VVIESSRRQYFDDGNNGGLHASGNNYDSTDRHYQSDERGGHDKEFDSVHQSNAASCGNDDADRSELDHWTNATVHGNGQQLDESQRNVVTESSRRQYFDDGNNGGLHAPGNDYDCTDGHYQSNERGGHHQEFIRIDQFGPAGSGHRGTSVGKFDTHADPAIHGDSERINKSERHVDTKSGSRHNLDHNKNGSIHGAGHCHCGGNSHPRGDQRGRPDKEF